jgi:hypothetical protein
MCRAVDTVAGENLQGNIEIEQLPVVPQTGS